MVKLKKGDRVKLIATHYKPSKYNPHYKSIHNCYGIVIGCVRRISKRLDVIWDNGCANTYRPSDLKLVNDILTSCDSIW